MASKKPANSDVAQHSRTVGHDSIKQSIIRALARRNDHMHEPSRRFQGGATAIMGREQIHGALAVLQQIPVSDLTDAALDEAVRRIETSAIRNAECLGAYMNHIAEHLRSIGCESEQEIVEYFDARDRVLVKLHLEASRPQCSPTGLKRLALQFALDARRPIAGDVYRFDIRRQNDVIVVREYPSAGMKASAIPVPGQQIRDILSVSLLSLIVQSPPQIYHLLDLIEQWLGGCPNDKSGMTQISHALPRAIETDLESSTITILGKTYAVDLSLVTIVHVLASANGLWLSSTKLQESKLLAGERIDRLIKKIPFDVRKYIERQRGKGYRLLVGDLA